MKLIILILIIVAYSASYGQNKRFAQAVKKIHMVQKADTAAWTSAYTIHGKGWNTLKFIKMVRYCVPEKEFDCIVGEYKSSKFYRVEFVLVLKNADNGRIKIQAFSFDEWRALVYQHRY